MKYLAGVLALAALCAAEPEADPVYALYAPYAPYWSRPYYASGYAGPLPGNSYQAVSRLHKREAEADPQFLLNTIPSAFPLLAPAGAVFNAPVVKSVVEAPAVVSHTVHAAPVPLAAPFSFAAPAPFTFAAAPAPFTFAAAPAPFLNSAVVGLGPRDCVTEGGCALKAALATGLPAATFGATTVLGRKRREAEAEAEAEADPALLYNSFYGNYYSSPYSYNPYASLPYSYAPYSYAPYSYAPYSHAPHNYYNAYYAAAAPYFHAAAPIVPAPAVAAPLVQTVAKQVTYTHLGAHPINPTTVLETEHRLFA